MGNSADPYLSDVLTMINPITTMQSYQLEHASFEIQNAKAVAKADQAKLDSEASHEAKTQSQKANETAAASEYALDVYV